MSRSRLAAFANLAFAWTILVSSGAFASSATNELLGLVPPDMAGCVIIEDAAVHTDRLTKSKIYDKFSKLPQVEEWRDSPEHAGLEAAKALLPAYFGVSLEDLGRNIFGQSVVMAFRPGAKAGEPDVGVLLLRAADESILIRLVDSVTSPKDGRETRELEYRGVRFVRRVEQGGRVDFVLRIGAVGVLCGLESAAKQVIDAHKDGRGLSSEPWFQSMRDSLPKDCLVQFLLNPRPYDSMVSSALPTEKPSSQTIREFWTAMRWTALSIRITDSVQIAWHASVDDKKLSPGSRHGWALASQPSQIWKNVPADALAAATFLVDFPSLWSAIEVAIPRDRDADLVRLIFGQLLAGHKPDKDLLPRLGPEIGAILLGPGPKGDEGPLGVAVLLQFQDAAKVDDGQVPLATAFEIAVRTFLVFVGLEWNPDAKSGVVQTKVEGDLRIHSILSPRWLPPWLAPSFAVHEGKLYFGSSPSALLRCTKTLSEGLLQSKFGEQTAKALPTNFALKLYVNVSACKQLLEANRPLLAAGLKAAGAPSEKALHKVELLTSLMGLADRVVGGVYTTDNASHWVLSIYPAKD